MNSKQNIQSYGRFKGAPWFTKISEALTFIGGAGGIGSHCAFQLARTSADVVVVDMDTVEEHNIAGQMYGKAHIGKKKVEAIKQVCNYLCGEDNITALDIEITEEVAQWQSIISRCDAVIAGFDNLKARRIVYDEWKANGKDNSIFLDGRLSAESFTVYVLTKNSTEEDYLAYEDTYFSEGERVELPCTYKATTHYGAGIAWWIVSQIANHINNLEVTNMPRTLANLEVHGALSMIDQPVLKVKTDVVDK